MIRLLLIGCAAFSEFGIAEQRKDAAETVQEGSVPQWLDYYKRERGFTTGEPKPDRPSSENRERQDAPPPKPPPPK